MELFVKKFGELSGIELYNILKLRSKVFVVEQQSIYLDMDDLDMDAVHIFFKENDNIEAYLRIINLDNANNIYKFGRVVSEGRRQGLGTKLLKAALSYAESNLSAKKISIDAQTYVQSFYAKQGFKAVSDEHLVDGIPHIYMELIL